MSWREIASEMASRQDALVERETRATGREIASILSRLKSDLTEFIEGRDRASFVRLVNAEVKDAFDEIMDRLIERLHTAARRATAMVADVQGVERVSIPRGIERAEIEGGDGKTWLRTVAADLREQLRALRGEDLSSAGVVSAVRRARSGVERVVRAAITAVVDEVRRMAIERSGEFEMIRQVSELDSGTTAVCRKYHLKTWRLPDYKPVGHRLPYAGGIPRHWGCRSVEVGVRAA